MKEELQQIQAVAIVTFLCVVISIHNTGEYGEWFEVSGMKEEILEPGKPENGTQVQQFEYSYYTSHYTYYENGEKELVGYFIQGKPTGIWMYWDKEGYYDWIDMDQV